MLDKMDIHLTQIKTEATIRKCSVAISQPIRREKNRLEVKPGPEDK